MEFIIMSVITVTAIIVAYYFGRHEEKKKLSDEFNSIKKSLVDAQHNNNELRDKLQEMQSKVNKIQSSLLMLQNIK